MEVPGTLRSPTRSILGRSGSRSYVLAPVPVRRGFRCPHSHLDRAEDSVTSQHFRDSRARRPIATGLRVTLG